MRSKWIACFLLTMAAAAYAKEPKTYQTGKLLQMDSVQCGVAEKSGQTFAGEMLGTDSTNKKTHDLLCQEYVLQSDKTTFRIRPRDEKHSVLLPLGDQAQFRLEKNRMLLRVIDLDNKEREYIVVSMAPRTDASTADAAPLRLNHLQ